MDRRIDLTQNMDFRKKRPIRSVNLNIPVRSYTTNKVVYDTVYIPRLAEWEVMDMIDWNYIRRSNTDKLYESIKDNMSIHSNRKYIKLGGDKKIHITDIDEELKHRCDRCGCRIINGTLCDKCNEWLNNYNNILYQDNMIRKLLDPRHLYKNKIIERLI